MPDLEKNLRKETQKWLNKLEGKDIDPKGKNSEKFKENIKAYIQDSKHFLQKEELIKAFEAIIWAWSWYEIGTELEIFE